MSTEVSLDLGELFELQEEKTDEPTTPVETKNDEIQKESDAGSDQAEPPVESADTTHPEETGRKSSASSRTAKQRSNAGSHQETSQGSTEGPSVKSTWHTNIIGVPKGRVNEYFQGVVAHDGTDGKQVLAPFKDIVYAQRQVYVDDITLENPEVLTTIYRIQGTFPDVLVRVPKEVFEAVLQHPEITLKRVTYSWVSDHLRPRRNYIVNHPERPTSDEIKKIDKHQEEVEWALKPWHEKEELKKKDIKYANMPEEEEVPLPVVEETEVATDTDRIEETEQLGE